MSPTQFRLAVVRPVLQRMGMWSDEAETLLMGTAAQESHFNYLIQIGGPAVSFYQIEPATALDIVRRYFRTRPDLEAKTEESIYLLSHADINWHAAKEEYIRQRLIEDLGLATAICRIRYWMVPEALPSADDIEGMGRYWKKHYNTVHGAGTVREFVMNYERFVK